MQSMKLSATRARAAAAALGVVYGLAVGSAAAQEAATVAPDPASPPPAVVETVPPAPPAAPPPAVVPIADAAADQILDEVRRALSAAPRNGVDRADHAALVKFYATRKEPLWLAVSGLKPAGQHVLAELARADEWGLVAQQLELPQPPADKSEPAALAALEIKLGLGVLKYARQARGGRVDPQQLSANLDQKLALREPGAVLEAVADTPTPGDYLIALHPRHEQFKRLKAALAKARLGEPEPEPARPAFVKLPDGPQLKAGSKHEQVVLLRQRLGLQARPDDQVFDAQLAEALKAFQREKGLQASGLLTPRTRQLLNAGAPKPPVKSAALAERIVANMERWRWMPEDMGAFHVWQNTPEYAVRVVKDGAVIHQAKIIVGKVGNQTPVFSAPMRTIVFNPEWGVPNSIKVKEILPYLRPAQDDIFSFFGGGVDTRVLEKHNLRVILGGRPVDPTSVNWGDVDIRRYTFVQPAGPTNVLGVVKFLFPNKHDVYMHDTPQRDLFGKDVRTFSHGCVRVQNPMRLAEVLLGADKGWSAEQVAAKLTVSGTDEVQLAKPIPVHLSYFTTVVDDEGKLSLYDDIYNHDVRLIAALAGKYVPPEATAEAEANPAAPRKGKRKSVPLIENLW